MGHSSCGSGDAELPGGCLAFLRTWLSVGTRLFLRVWAACQHWCLRLEEILASSVRGWAVFVTAGGRMQIPLFSVVVQGHLKTRKNFSLSSNGKKKKTQPFLAVNESLHGPLPCSRTDSCFVSYAYLLHKNQTPCAFSETVSVSSQAIAVFVLEFGVCCWLLPVVSVFEEVFSCCSFSRVFADPLSSVASFQADLLKNQLLWTSFIARSAATEAAWNTWICDKRQDWK